MWNEAGAAPVPAREPATLRDADPPPAPQAAQIPLLPVTRTPWEAEVQPAPETPQRSRKGVSAKPGPTLSNQAPSRWAVRVTNGLKNQVFLSI